MWKPSSGLEGYLVERDVPLVVVSTDRTFSPIGSATRFVATERGIARNLSGHTTSQHGAENSLEREATQSAFDRQQKSLASQQAYHRPIPVPVPPAAPEPRSREKSLLEKSGPIEARWRASPAQSSASRWPRSGRQASP